MTNVLMARFAIDHRALQGCEVAVLRFPYREALDRFLGTMIGLDPRRREQRQRLDRAEYPPYQRLNDVLRGTAPGLIHAFEEYEDSNYDKRWKESGIFASPRRMLALTTRPDGQPVWRPSGDQIADLAGIWAGQWAQENFPDEIKLRGGREALETMLEDIAKAQVNWDVPIDASTLWEQHQKDKLVWSALPSVLAAVFVNRTAGQPLTIGDERDKRIFEWRLVQEGGRLAVVSEPFYYDHGRKRDLVSYKLEFVVQTQAGRPMPWIAVYIRLRRWADRPILSKNYMRDVSVMLTLGSERKPGWHTQPSMVALRVSGKIKDRGLHWTSGASALLEAWNAPRGLVDPNDLFANPRLYAQPDKYGDTYLVLHAAGMNYASPYGKGRTSHLAQAGTSLQERAELMQHISDVMRGLLAPDTALPVDDLATLGTDDIFSKHLLALCTFDDIGKPRALPIERQAGQSVGQRRHQILRQSTDSAVARACGKKSLSVLFVTKEAPAKRELERQVRKLLFLGDIVDKPDSISFTDVTIPVELMVPPGSAIPEFRSPKQKREHQATLDVEWQAKVREWTTLLKEYVRPGTHNLALIELDGSMDKATEKDGWLKQAIRCACAEVGIVSQMLYTIPPEATREQFHPSKPAHLARVENAARDLVLRNLHVIYGNLGDVYKYAGLDAERAERLIVRGLYRFRANWPLRIDYPLAVDLYPDGSVQVILPDDKGNAGQPVSYLEAVTKVGQVFSLPMNDTNKRRIDYDVDKADDRLMRFLAHVLKNPLERPTLVVLEADGWRDKIRLSGNDSLRPNELTLNRAPYTSDQLLNLYVLRVRDAGNLGETPQYVAGDHEAWDMLDHLTDSQTMLGVVDTNAGSPLFHYFSFGRPVIGALNQDNELYSFAQGGEIPYKHQQAVEFVPFFMQQENDALPLARIAHFLRFSPAWEGGNIVLPYPLHLARTLVDDAIDALKPRL